MHPVLFEIPWLGVPVYTYGVLLAFGYGLAIWTAARFAASEGFPSRHIYNLGFFVIIGGVVGGKVFQILVDVLAYGEGLGASLRSTGPAGGAAGVFLGGILTAGAATVIYTRVQGLGWWRPADYSFAAIPVGQAIGRLGCLTAGCCWGRPSTMPWAIVFPEAGFHHTGVPAGVPLHPTQLYSVTANLLLLGVLVLVLRRRSFDGQVVLSWAIGYGALRFFMELFRGDDRGNWILGLSTSQLIALGLIAGGLALWPLLRRRGGGREAALNVRSQPST